MSKPSFKAVSVTPKPRQTPEEILATARQADRASPSVKPQTTPDKPEPVSQSEPKAPAERIVGMNFKVLLGTSEAVAEAARKRKVSMKTVVMEALKAAGVGVSPLDLEDRTPSRRKGL
jgi:hypothetical protein